MHQIGERESGITPSVVRLRDYRPPEFVIPSVSLRFDLGESVTTVESRLSIKRNESTATTLVLQGEELKLISIDMDGVPLRQDAYHIDAEKLTLHHTPDQFTLTIRNHIHPENNTALMGLYLSNGIFCTQCEAEGFRKITYFVDRPDVLSVYTTTIEANRRRCPVLLSNGNLKEQGVRGDRHWTTWHDPFPKPCYLFAVVAGDLGHIRDEFVTRSGKRVSLYVFAEPHNIDKCDHALASMKQAMIWDEETYGREYDLERSMVVAVDDFNMGAMENKGLNIFNSKYVLAKPTTATDADYESILGVIGHEYFHNWSGNRVTCRDWFQLSLKEGFTVFRDQEFSADLTSRGVKRIEDVNRLRTDQFREDAGPMAHPVRPDSYLKINNFYTFTVYNKGAEVVRMLYRLVGGARFHRGTDLYFHRHDGQAVTTEEFVKAMEDANKVDLKQFRRWYSQAGTPRIHFRSRYDGRTRSLTLNITQSCPATPGQTEKKPFYIPLSIALLNSAGGHVPLQLEGEDVSVDEHDSSRVLVLSENTHRFRFINVAEKPVISLLRGFSAPVNVERDITDEDLCFLMAYDTDPFSRWEAGQELMRKHILNMIDTGQRAISLNVTQVVIEAFHRSLEGTIDDPAFTALLLKLPSETLLAEAMDEIDPVAVHAARRHMKKALAEALEGQFLKLYEVLTDSGPYHTDQLSIGRRRLRNLCLSFLMELDTSYAWKLCDSQFKTANNMTDQLAALRCLVNSEAPCRDRALDDFYACWKNEPLVVDKWLVIQATARSPNTMEVVQSLIEHPAFSAANPNKVRALIGAFAAQNPLRFHGEDGGGYRFVADWVVKLDPLNPQMAARLASSFQSWRRYDNTRRAAMRAQLERIQALSHVSLDVFEVASKALA